MCRRCMSLMILMVKKLLKDFAKKKMLGKNQSEFRVEKSNQEKR